MAAFCDTRRHLQALEAAILSMHETMTHYDEEEMLTAICIHIPLHIRMPHLTTNLFYGDWFAYPNVGLSMQESVLLQQMN
jgi:hypothetical protein